jgi:glycosyltransferase involved in cell wall biosynthesis
MTTRDATPVAMLVVPPGTPSPDALAASIRTLHPAWTILPVWAGDPHLRPVLAGTDRDSGTERLEWFDPDGEGSIARQVQLVSRAPHDAVWLRAITAARRSLDEGAESMVVLVAGSVAVLGTLDPLVDALLDPSGDAGTRRRAVLVPRVFGNLGDDSRSPGERDLIGVGSWSDDVLALSADAGELLDWLEQQLSTGPVEGCIGQVLDRASIAFGLPACPDPSIGVGEWRWDVDEPSLLDLPRFDAEQPWVLNPDRSVRARVDVAAHPRRSDVLRRAAPQLSGAPAAMALPGGLIVDDVIRSLVSDAGDGSSSSAPPAPPAWSEPGAFREWIEPRYWSALHEGRRDLAVAFPTPRGADAPGFRNWCRRAFVDDAASALLDVPSEPDERWSTSPTLSPSGVNVVGYLTRESSLGDVARRLRRCLVDAGIEVSSLAQQRTASPHIDGSRSERGVIAHRNTVAVVNADQFPALRLDHPELFAARTHLVGYWFWELEHIPKQMRDVASTVDEIWVGSKFVADAFGAAVDTPVRHVPIPIGEPVVAERDRASFTPLASFGDRFVFAVVFDHFSITERKNPVGVIEAFRRAFAPDEGPVLVVKSMNAAKRWPHHQQVVAAAGDRPDIVVWDEHLDRADHMAFIRSVDALVALHRSEGLGLHLAEAMWLGTPVIATRYSGNLDFMDDSCSILIDASPVAVSRGEGVYPPDAVWADPDLDQAAAAMRSLAADPARCAALAQAGRHRMEHQPSLADTGRRIAALLGLEVAS